MTLYRRSRGDRRTERLAAAAGAAAGAAVGGVVWYLARLWLQREPLAAGGEGGRPTPAESGEDRPPRARGPAPRRGVPADRGDAAAP